MKKFKIGKIYIYGTTQLLSWKEKIELLLFECISVNENEACLRPLFPNIMDLPPDHVGCFKQHEGNMIITDDRYGYFVLFDDKKKQQLSQHYHSAQHIMSQVEQVFNCMEIIW